MKLTNDSGFPAAMLVGSMGEFEQMGIVVCKVTYKLNADGGLVPVDAKSAWPVFREPVVVDGVNFGSELDYLKQGIDVVVFGKAVAPRGYRVTTMTAEVLCGPLHHSIKVIGDRRWQQGRGGLLGMRTVYNMTEPEPFVSMPLTNDRAFGGSIVDKGQTIPHGTNPDGRGFVVDVSLVDGTPLPNLERVDQPIQSWQDKPIPACLFKPSGVIYDAQGPFSSDGLFGGGNIGEASRKLAARCFNQTVPDLICPEGKLGCMLELKGFDPDGPVRFPLPPEITQPETWGPFVVATVGPARSQFPMRVVGITAFMPQRALVVTYRSLFRYLFVPEELRSAELLFRGNASIKPMTGEQHA